LDHPPDPRQDQVLDHPHEPAEYPEGEPAPQVFADHPHEPFTTQAGLAIPQAELDHPPLQRQVQEDEPPHEPAEYPEGEPAPQVLLDHPHEPLIEQGALVLLHPVAFVPPPDPRQVQVDEPPHEPATLDADVPAEQAYCVALLHEPFTIQAAFAIPQTEFDPPPLQRQFQLLDHPHEPAENPEGEPAEHVLLDHPQDQFTAQAGLAREQVAEAAHPAYPLQVHCLVVPQDMSELSEPVQ
jgi:hypothetical protein